MSLMGWEGGKQRDEVEAERKAPGTLQHSVLQSARASAASLEPNPFEIRFREGYAPGGPIRMGLGRNAPVTACSAT